MRTTSLLIPALVTGFLVATSPVAGADPPTVAFGPAAPVADLNSPAADGCPYESPDGRSFFLASTRPGGLGGNDIWVSHRRRERDPWSAPVHLEGPVNSPANDFCPTPLPGN